MELVIPESLMNNISNYIIDSNINVIYVRKNAIRFSLLEGLMKLCNDEIIYKDIIMSRGFPQNVIKITNSFDAQALLDGLKSKLALKSIFCYIMLKNKYSSSYILNDFIEKYEHSIWHCVRKMEPRFIKCILYFLPIKEEHICTLFYSLFRKEELLEDIFNELIDYIKQYSRIAYGATLDVGSLLTLKYLINYDISAEGLDEDYLFSFNSESILIDLFLLGLGPGWIDDFILRDNKMMINKTFKFFAPYIFSRHSTIIPLEAWWARTSYLLGGITYQIVDNGLEEK